MNKQTTGRTIALYSRLSREVMLTGESLSIQNQHEILESYAAQNGFAHTRHFSKMYTPRLIQINFECANV
jgi:hypothetical protein